jgi:Flp pilus assembly protein TadG
MRMRQQLKHDSNRRGRLTCGRLSHRPLNRGVAATELAICLPIVVLLVVATIEACSMIFLQQSLSVAAYEGVRTAIESGATAAEVQSTCQQILSDRRVAGGTVTINPADIASIAPGDYVNVIVSAPCAGNSVVPIQFYRGRTLTTTASMMVEF